MTASPLPARAGVRTIIAAAALAAAGCATGPEVGTAGPSAPQLAPGPLRTGLAGEADRLLEADRAFAQRALEAGAPTAFKEFFEERGIRLPAAGEPVIGAEAVRAALAAGPTLLLWWEPRYAEVFAPGNWGWTWGDWQAHEPGVGGRRIAQGRYVNLWRKEKDGRWKVHMDMGPLEREASP